YRVGPPAGAATARGDGHLGAVPGTAADAAVALSAKPQAAKLDELLPRRRLGLETNRALAPEPVPRPSASQGRGVDAGALRGERRPRGDFPADDLHGHRAEMPRRAGRRPGIPLGDEA